MNLQPWTCQVGTLPLSYISTSPLLLYFMPKWIWSLLLTYEGGMIDNRWPVLLVYPVVRAVSLPPPRPPGLYKAVALASLLETGLELWLAYVTIVITQCSFSALLSFLIIFWFLLLNFSLSPWNRTWLLLPRLLLTQLYRMLLVFHLTPGLVL